MSSAHRTPGTESLAAYVPGDEWLSVVTGERLAVLEPTTSPAFAAQLWRRMEAEASIEELVSMVPLAHDPDLSFAVIEVGTHGESAESTAATVVVRGTVAVDLYTADGLRRARAGETKPWLLAEYQHVEAFTIGPAGQEPMPAPTAPPGALIARNGTFRTRQLVWSLTGRLLSALEPRFDAISSDDLPRIGAEQPPAERTVDAVPGDEAPGSNSGDDATARGRPDRYWVRLPGGTTELLRRPLIVGRNPVDRRPGRAEVELRTISSPSKAVSSTHVRIEQHGASVTIIDEHSTNGTTVTVPGREPQRLRPGGSLAVTGRATVELGGDRIVEIVPPHG